MLGIVSDWKNHENGQVFGMLDIRSNYTDFLDISSEQAEISFLDF